jgi:hypothetical protein
MPLDPDAPPPLVIDGADMPQGGPGLANHQSCQESEPPASRDDINKAFEELSKPAGGPEMKKDEPGKKKSEPAKKSEPEKNPGPEKKAEAAK